MIEHLKSLFLILNKTQKKRLLILTVLMTISGLFEIISIISLIEYVKFLTAENQQINFLILGKIFDEQYLSLFLTVKSFGIILIFILILNMVLALALIYFSSQFSYITGGEIEFDLYKLYLKKNYLFHINTTSSHLLNNLNKLIPRITNNIIEPALVIFSKLFFIIPMIIGLIIFEPAVTMFAVSLSFLLYLLFYVTFRKILWSQGKIENKISKDKYTVLQESFGGIKDIKIFNTYSFFFSSFKSIYTSIANLAVKRGMIGKSPKYLIELFVFVLTVILVIVLNTQYNLNFNEIITYLSIFVISAYKILPAFQAIYYNGSLIRNNLPAFIDMREDLEEAKRSILLDKSNNLKNEFSFKHFENLNLKKISFSYKSKKNSSTTLKDINFLIKKGNKVAITGPSGSGKSTLIHIIAGLIDPDSGSIEINGENLSHKNMNNWQDLLGFVPQNIFLSEKSIMENIAFGKCINEINLEKVKRVCEITKLKDLITSLPSGYKTLIGERGAKLSGGQQQRLGIARAIYNDPKILIFDEATNALDALTENEILNSINLLSKNMTVIMIAHRLDIIKNFDKIIFLDDGLLIDSGDYTELYKKNSNFKKLVDLHNNYKEKK